MQWYRIRQAESKHSIAKARIDIPAAIRVRMVREAKQSGADLAHDRLVFMRRDDEWYTEFNLDINPPEFVVNKLRARGWEMWG